MSRSFDFLAPVAGIFLLLRGWFELNREHYLIGLAIIGSGLLMFRIFWNYISLFNKSEQQELTIKTLRKKKNNPNIMGDY